MKKSPLESSLAEFWDTLSESCADCAEKYEKQIRKAPLTSVLCAAAAGYILQFLPIRRVVWGLVRIGTGLIQPAILIFGAVKLASCLQQEKKERSGGKASKK